MPQRSPPTAGSQPQASATASVASACAGPSGSRYAPGSRPSIASRSQHERVVAGAVVLEHGRSRARRAQAARAALGRERRVDAARPQVGDRQPGACDELGDRRRVRGRALVRAAGDRDVARLELVVLDDAVANGRQRLQRLGGAAQRHVDSGSPMPPRTAPEASTMTACTRWRASTTPPRTSSTTPFSTGPHTISACPSCPSSRRSSKRSIPSSRARRCAMCRSRTSPWSRPRRRR